jgi:hypothetical protein
LALPFGFVFERTMIYVGIDDTDTLDDPGTNQLARHIVRELSGHVRGRMILRHQLLEDPRVPCTKKNGCASIAFDRPNSGSLDDFITSLRQMIVPWCPRGSDPGLCVAEDVPPAVVEWGLRCQRELLKQADARQIAAEHRIYLEGLGGTEDGVVGALAAIGLMATKNDGRVIHFDSDCADWYELTGCLDVNEIRQLGVDEILIMETGTPLTTGVVDIGKRLRPNYRESKIVLYVARGESPHWEAVRVL